MTKTANRGWKSFVKALSEDQIMEVKEFLRPYGLGLEGKGSIVRWPSGLTECWIGIDMRGRATYGEQLGTDLKKLLGVQKLIMDGREI